MNKEILAIIAKNYPFGLQEIKEFYDNRQPRSFDWVIDVCNHALEMGFADLESAERDIFKEMGEGGDIEKRALEAAFEKINLEAEVQRLRLYTNPKLFAAASSVLEAWDDYNQVSIPSLIEALEESFIPRLIEAVAWWDSLPFDPDKDTEKLPKYEG